MTFSTRIEQLEKEIEALKTRIEHLENLGGYVTKEPEIYDVEEDSFDNGGGYIDWFIWEPPSSAHVFVGRRGSVPMSRKHREARVVLPAADPVARDRGEVVKVRVPLTRYGDVTGTMELPRENLTVETMMQRIFDYYDTPVTKQDIENSLSDSRGYAAKAMNDYENGHRVVRADLLGSHEYFSSSSTPDSSCCPRSLTGPMRRGPLECIGRVRFEGIRLIREPNVEDSIAADTEDWVASLHLGR